MCTNRRATRKTQVSDSERRVERCVTEHTFSVPAAITVPTGNSTPTNTPQQQPQHM